MVALLIKCENAHRLGEVTVDRLDRRDVKDTAFDVVLRGYDKRQVDERLRFLGSELAAAEASLQAAHERAALLEDGVSQARARPGGDSPVDSNFGARVEKILVLAEEEARQVRSQADAAAAALVENARAEAAEQRQQAEQEVAAWRAEANRRAAEQDGALQRRSAALQSACQEWEQESEQIRARVRAEAEQIRKAVAQEVDELFTAARAEAGEVGNVARAEAAQLVAQARTEANRLIATANEAAQQRERASAHELHQLSRLREEINADLYRAKEVLDGLFGTTKPAAAARRQERLPDPDRTA